MAEQWSGFGLRGLKKFPEVSYFDILDSSILYVELMTHTPI